MKRSLLTLLTMILVMIPLTPAAMHSEDASGIISSPAVTQTVERTETCFACIGSGHCELCRGSGWFYICEEYTLCDRYCVTCSGEGVLHTTYVLPVSM